MNKGNLLLLHEHKPELKDIADFLRQENYQIQNFVDSKGLVNCFEKWDIDLVILPLEMSIQKTLDVCVKIKGNRISEDVFVVFVSRHKSEDCILAAFEAGADDFLYLPINKRLLANRIQAMLRRRRNYYSQQAS
ncbi:MAG: response regulator [Vicingaceae bacterium]